MAPKLLRFVEEEPKLWIDLIEEAKGWEKMWGRDEKGFGYELCQGDDTARYEECCNYPKSGSNFFYMTIYLFL